MADIVFTYAQADIARAHAIAEALKGFGVEVMWDRTLLPGERYDTAITKRLAEAKAVVVLWSNNSVADNLIIDEASLARDQGKLVPVRVDLIDAPIGFRQLEMGDLVGFPGPASAGAIRSLASALVAMTNPSAPHPVYPVPPQPHVAVAPSRDRLFTGTFWALTLMLGLFSGLLYFVSPQGRAQMNGNVAENVGFLVGNTIAALLIFGLARVLLYWSRRWVGKPPGSYFTIEVWILLAASVLIGLINTFSPNAEETGGTGLVGLTHQLNLAMMGAFLLFPPAIALVRGIIRLIRGKPAVPINQADVF